MSIKKILIGIGILVIAIISILQINQPKVIIQNNKDVKNKDIKINSLTYTCLSEMKNEVSELYSCSFEDFESQKSKVEPIQITEVDIGRVNERRNKTLNNLKRDELIFKSLSVDDQYYQLKKPKLDLISDQSFVDYDNKRILFDKDNEIPRFESKIVDERLDRVYTNYNYLSHPEKFDGVEPEPIKVVNYRFFQYLKPIDVERMIGDTKIGLINGFDFYWLENGNELKKIPFKKCGDGICYYKEKYSEQYSISLICREVCNGYVTHDSKDLTVYINKEGMMLMYNEYNENGNYRPEILNPKLQENEG